MSALSNLHSIVISLFTVGGTIPHTQPNSLVIHFNAYLYNDSKIKEISIALSYDNERQPILTVRDNGVGLESDVFNNAVIPFGLHTPEKEHESLGLAVVNMFCKSVGGRMAHRALLNGGTSIKLVMSEARTSDFLLTLPDPKPIMDKNDYTYQLLSQAIEFD